MIVGHMSGSSLRLVLICQLLCHLRLTPLGFRLDDLRDGLAKTANGEIAIKLGTLSSLWIGNVVAHDVEVAFVVDPGLPETRLLGMSFLGRFRVTLDEDNDQLILTTTR